MSDPVRSGPAPPAAERPATPRLGTLSVIVLAYLSSRRLEQVCDAIRERLTAEAIPFEIVIMDDGSTDDTQDVADRLERARPEVRSFALSRNFTTNYSKFAGLSVCTGDCAVFVPDDFQRSLDTVVRMYRLWQRGEKIVVDYRESRSDGFLSDLAAHTYYAIMSRFSEVRFPPGGADGALLDREVIDILNTQIHPRNTSLMVEVLRLGFDPHFLPAERQRSDEPSRWTFGKKVRLAADTFFSASSFPIRLITVIGLLTFVASVVLIVVVASIRLLWSGRLLGFSIPGWTTTLILVALFNGLNLLGVGVVAEYVWRISEEVKGRPGYIIKRKRPSRAAPPEEP